MKQIVSTLPPAEIIDVKDALYRRHSDETIIAYETRAKNGLAILIKRAGSDRAGFIYHSKLILNQFGDRKFEASTREEVIEKVLKAGRTVLLFENFEEFVEHAAKLNKL